METIDPELAAALSTLLEGERAGAEMEVALASGATEFMEREALAGMGYDDLDACSALHEYLDRRQSPVSWRIHAAVYSVLNEVRYDDRLRAFAAHQRAVGEHASSLLSDGLDANLSSILAAIRDTHERHVQWSEKRADDFAATRLLDFRTPEGRVLLRRPVGAAPATDLSPADSFPSAPTVSLDDELTPYASGEDHAPRPTPSDPEESDNGAAQTPGEDTAGDPLPDTTLE
jgi:hypothetical protein